MAQRSLFNQHMLANFELMVFHFASSLV